MQSTEIFQRLATFSLATAGALTLASCTSTSSNLSTLSRQNAQAVAKIAEETPATEPLAVGAAPTGTAIVPAAAAPTAPLSAVSSDQIVGLPSPPVVDPVAIPKPAPTAPATTLASVPRTPVSNRPTNQIMMVRTTAYTHTESDHIQYGRKSAAGNTLQYGSQVRSAAADWSKYPLGTRFMIEGLPYEYVVDDYGSALVGTETIDIYKPEKGTMNNWGVRNVPIRVLEWGSFEESRKILDGRKNVRHADHVREMLHEIEKKGRNGSISLSPTGTSA
jgi:3D (Asp-Asp-Asp) domain-containing protein